MQNVKLLPYIADILRVAGLLMYESNKITTNMSQNEYIRLILYRLRAAREMPCNNKGSKPYQENKLYDTPTPM